MKICFMGLGSIGARHFRNLSTILTERGIEHTIDALRSSNRLLPGDIMNKLHKQYVSIDEIPNDYDIVFICTPTANHYSDIQKLVSHTKHMFIEKPVFDGVYNIDALQLRDDAIYYVACPLRYNAVLQYLKDYIREKKVFSARAICSTYLPNWRPGVDYRTVYSAHQNMGGGVSIDLIHEWDYISWLFGMPISVKRVYGQYSNLEIDSDDLALYLGEYSDKLVSLHLDYFGRVEKREIELFTSDDTVVGDIRNSKIHFLKENKTIDFSKERNVYQLKEIAHFLDLIVGKKQNDSDVEHALNVLKIAKGEYRA